GSASEGGTPGAWLAGLSEEEAARALLELVRTQAATVLGHDSAAAVPPDGVFKDLGFDSLTAVELRNRLNEATGCRLSPTVVFDHPTPRSLATHLHQAWSSTAAPAAAPDRAPAARAALPDGDAIAIVAMGCRYPGGVASPEDLWKLVSAGADAVTGFPTDRGWDLDALYDPDPDKPGTSYTRHGAFVEGAGRFDAAFFGISPREALAMDPQQRLLLETAWETFERAGIDPTSLRTTATGVFVGALSQEYGSTLLHEAPDGLDGVLLTGNALSLMSGRLSYVLGLQGPAVTVDTACSSSLVAMHQAAQSLRLGECTLALAGGATVIATPGTFTAFSRQRAMSADGRCRAFAAAADGTGWGEGVGLVLLERLSDARRLGHPVLAVLRGSAVNQDGASNGLTAPNGTAQQRVIRTALANAGLRSADVDAVEGHGTGTTLGDPIEAQALLATYGQDRDPERPLRLGSVKSNLGHTQAAAGVAGVIKMVQALRHEVLPRTLHVDEPSPYVDWSAGAVRLLTEEQPWLRDDAPRRAGVSSFGISGTNAHVIVEEAPAAAADVPSGPDDTTALPLVVSGRTEEAARAQAEQVAVFLERRPEVPVDRVARLLAASRTVVEHRAAVVATDRAGLAEGLRAAAAGTELPGVSTGAGTVLGEPVFVFPGQGSQWPGMARELIAADGAFARRLAECARALEPYTDWDLNGVLLGGDGEPDLDRVDVVQPALWAVMVALAAAWEDLGVRPAAVVGHSQGEIAAATVAGVLSLDDAARVVALRSRLIASLAGHGGMTSLALGAEQTRALVAELGLDLHVAAVNSPAGTVVSGASDDLDRLQEHCDGAGVRARRVPVDYASHSPEMEQLRDELGTLLAPVAPRPARIPFYSSLTGGRAEGEELDDDYWYRNLRHTVDFDSAVRALRRDGHGAFIEVSAHPVLTLPLHQILQDTPGATTVQGTLRRDHGGSEELANAAALAWAQGVTLRPQPAPAHPELPTYPFQGSHHWLTVSSGASRGASDLGAVNTEHPVLGAAVELPDSETVVFTGRLSAGTHPWLAGPGGEAAERAEGVEGIASAPQWLPVELAIRAGDQVGAGHLHELDTHEPLLLPESGGVQLRVTVGEPGGTGLRPVSVHSRRGDEAVRRPWTCHATGHLAQEGAAPDWDLEAWPPADARSVPVYDAAPDGAALPDRGVQAVWRRDDELFAEVTAAGAGDAESAAFGLHPVLADAVLHTLRAVDEAAGPQRVTAWREVAL
ncbi:type I polyketide synthase, partial [Streptomyces sparsus]